MKNGTYPTKKSHKKYSYHRTFGSSIQLAPTAFNFDAGFGFPNQNSDGLPQGCTGYTQSELCQDEDLIVYLPRYTYDQTLAIEGVIKGDPSFEQIPCTIEDSLKSTIVYGVDRGDGINPVHNRRGAYYDAIDGSDMDAFDSMVSAMWTNYQKTGKKSSVSFGCPWFQEFEMIKDDGVIISPPSWTPPSGTPWHNSKICGVTFVNGVEVLVDKSWQGPHFGNGGYCYFNRAQINSLMAIPGATANVLAPYVGANMQNVKLTILELIASYTRLLISKLLK